jgi:hypothetical protein
MAQPESCAIFYQHRSGQSWQELARKRPLRTPDDHLAGPRGIGGAGSGIINVAAGIGAARERVRVSIGRIDRRIKRIGAGPINRQGCRGGRYCQGTHSIRGVPLRNGHRIRGVGQCATAAGDLDSHRSDAQLEGERTGSDPVASDAVIQPEVRAARHSIGGTVGVGRDHQRIGKDTLRAGRKADGDLEWGGVGESNDCI